MKTLILIPVILVHMFSALAYGVVVDVLVVDSLFQPSVITVNVGDTVRWINQGQMIHTTTSGSNCVANGIWNSGLLIPGQSFDRVFDQPGTFPYFCAPHCREGHVGRVTVVARPTSAGRIGVFRNGMWALYGDGSDRWDSKTTDNETSFGLPGDIPITGDWNRDGVEEIGVKRGTNWYLDYNGNMIWDGCRTTSGEDKCYIFGFASDMPVTGDWNGDGKDKIGVFKEGSWYLDYNGNGSWDGCEIDKCYLNFFGLPTDIPVAGDWNRDGITEIGVFSRGVWVLDFNGDGLWNGYELDRVRLFGSEEDNPVVGDWNGDGIDDIGVFREGNWYLDRDGSGDWSGCSNDGCYTFGTAEDRPVSGNW